MRRSGELVRVRAGDRTCRLDLLELDGSPLPVRLTAGSAGLELDACSPVTLEAGAHRLTAASGAGTGIDVNRLVLSSDRTGRPAPVSARDLPTGASGATVRVANAGAGHLEVTAQTDGQPFWLVLGESSSSGWHASTSDARLGPRQLVDGYANGWLVSPDRAGTLSISLRWGPQRLLPLGGAVSVATLAACGWILWRGRRLAALGPGLAARPALSLGPPDRGRYAPGSALLAALVTLGVATLFVPPVMALAGALALLVGWRLPRGPVLLAAVACASLAISRVDHRPSLAWIAVVIVAADALGPRRASVTPD